MYDYDYEAYILLLLRLLCFLREDNPAAFSALVKESGQLCLDSAYELADLFLLGDAGFLDLDFEDDGEYELTILCLSHPVIDRFLALNDECNAIRIGGHVEQIRKKVFDIVEFYACGTTNCVCRFNVSFDASSALVRLTLSPDCYEPLELANSLVDMLLHFQQENQRMEALLGSGEASGLALDDIEKEAA